MPHLQPEMPGKRSVPRSGVLMKNRPRIRLSRQDTVLAAVRAWQTNGAVHPLTCVNDSAHALLEGVKDGDSVVLRCPTCDYRQELTPPVIVRSGRDSGDRARIAKPMAAGLEAAMTRLLEIRQAA